MFFALLPLLGCGSSDPDAVICREGTTLEADGHCHPPPLSFPPTLEGALDALGPCEPAGGAGELDVARGCANGACAGDRFTDMVEALGEEVTCATASHDPKFVYCTWDSLGVDGLFRDDDENDVPDPQARTDRVHLFGPHVGSTVEGAGVGATIPCFVDSLGYPTRFAGVDVGGTLILRELIYDDYGVFAYDLGDDDGTGLPNGYIDNVYLYGE